MNTTKTWTTKYGATLTCTLADAMINRARIETDTALWTVGEAFYRTGLKMLGDAFERKLAARNRKAA